MSPSFQSILARWQHFTADTFGFASVPSGVKESKRDKERSDSKDTLQCPDPAATATVNLKENDSFSSDTLVNNYCPFQKITSRRNMASSITTKIQRFNTIASRSLSVSPLLKAKRAKFNQDKGNYDSLLKTSKNNSVEVHEPVGKDIFETIELEDAGVRDQTAHTPTPLRKRSPLCRSATLFDHFRGKMARNKPLTKSQTTEQLKPSISSDSVESTKETLHQVEETSSEFKIEPQDAHQEDTLPDPVMASDTSEQEREVVPVDEPLAEVDLTPTIPKEDAKVPEETEVVDTVTQSTLIVEEPPTTEKDNVITPVDEQLAPSDLPDNAQVIQIPEGLTSQTKEDIVTCKDREKSTDDTNESTATKNENPEPPVISRACTLRPMRTIKVKSVFLTSNNNNDDKTSANDSDGKREPPVIPRRRVCQENEQKFGVILSRHPSLSRSYPSKIRTLSGDRKESKENVNPEKKQDLEAPSAAKTGDKEENKVLEGTESPEEMEIMKTDQPEDIQRSTSLSSTTLNRPKGPKRRLPSVRHSSRQAYQESKESPLRQQI